MALTSEVVARRYLSISTGTPVVTDIVAFAATDVIVFYGKAGLIAVQNVDYTIDIDDEVSGAGTFIVTITPLASFLAKIDALILADPTEVNYMTVRRTLDYETVATPGSVRNTVFTSRELDRAAMRDIQLAEETRRAVKVGPQNVDTDLNIDEVIPDRAMVFNSAGDGVTSGPTVDEIELADQRATDAEAARDAAQATAAAVALEVAAAQAAATAAQASETASAASAASSAAQVSLAQSFADAAAAEVPLAAAERVLAETARAAAEATLLDFKGDWATATAYEVQDLVHQNGSVYFVAVAHTSGDFDTDLAAARLLLFLAGGVAATVPQTAFAREYTANTGVETIDLPTVSPAPVGVSTFTLQGTFAGASIVGGFLNLDTALVADGNPITIRRIDDDGPRDFVLTPTLLTASVSVTAQLATVTVGDDTRGDANIQIAVTGGDYAGEVISFTPAQLDALAAAEGLSVLPPIATLTTDTDSGNDLDAGDIAEVTRDGLWAYPGGQAAPVISGEWFDQTGGLGDTDSSYTGLGTESGPVFYRETDTTNTRDSANIVVDNGGGGGPSAAALTLLGAQVYEVSAGAVTSHVITGVDVSVWTEGNDLPILLGADTCGGEITNIEISGTSFGPVSVVPADLQSQNNAGSTRPLVADAIFRAAALAGMPDTVDITVTTSTTATGMGVAAFDGGASGLVRAVVDDETWSNAATLDLSGNITADNVAVAGVVSNYNTSVPSWSGLANDAAVEMNAGEHVSVGYENGLNTETPRTISVTQSPSNRIAGRVIQYSTA